MNGYGDVLSLTDGRNMFDMAAIKNNLSITAAENCQITDVTVNQTPVQPL
ncbi:MAG: hypothetical protein K2J29_00475 [Muribaculaceae bacterium]|nr:hypothetical protein [Bacteroides sp.]MDE6803094.1 hypothetical protein [Muribaculaceae bacterium]MDE6842723.1 hypothetical protein [Muribaculaceae bacterium]